MDSKLAIVIDFDSTIISVESLEILANSSLKNNPQKNQILNQISDYTNLAMNGHITFEESLNMRFDLMKINSDDIKKTIAEIKSKIDHSFLNNINFFEQNIENVYIISGGFKTIIQSTIGSISKLNWNIYANEFLFNENNHIIGINKDNPLAFSKGKVEIIKKLNLDCDVIIIGDGYTDYEVKKFHAAKYFLAYTAHINRENVSANADLICKNFNEVIDFINKKAF